MRSKAHRTVALAIDLSTRAGNMKLSGIYRYLRNDSPWDLRLITGRNALTEKVARKFAGIVDGFILIVPGTSAASDLIARSGKPVVTIDFSNRAFAAKNHASVRIDPAEIAETAVQHFQHLGRYAAYAFLGDPQSRIWSQARRHAFKIALSERGIPVASLVNDTSLRTALPALPKPVAVLAADDLQAMELVRFCKTNGLAIPEAVSVLGIDNDERYVLGVTPSVSSIEPAYEQEGFEAAKLLDALMSGRRKTPRVIRCGVNGIFARESTANRPPSEMLVTRAEEFVKLHSDAIRTSADVAGHLGVSRRLLDLRFHELGKTTLTDVIREAKLTRLASLLRSDDAPIDALVRRVGFTNPNWVKTVFRRRYKMTMSAWRKRSPVTSP